MQAQEAALIQKLLGQILEADGFTDANTGKQLTRRAVMDSFRTATKLVVEAKLAINKAKT